MPHAPAYSTATDLARLVARREVSPTELARHALDAIERLDPTLNAFLDTDADLVLRRAAEAEQRLARGGDSPPLLGVPVAVKDVEATEDFRTTRGSLVYRDHRAGVDAIHVARLRAAGAVIVGKTNTPEFALLGETRNRLGPECRNPWDPARTTGGSSGGSAAAVAAGMVPLATGTDTGGSITIPAGFCGTAGFKPTHRRIPVWPNADEWPPFYDTGPIARSVDDLALALSVMAGHDTRDPEAVRGPAPSLDALTRPSDRNLRVAYAEQIAGLPVEARNRTAVRRAAEACRDRGFCVDEAAPDCAAPAATAECIARAEEYRYRGHLLAAHRAELEPSTVAMMEAGMALSAGDHSKALADMRAIRTAFDAFFERFDVLLVPATACEAFPLGQVPERIDGVRVEPAWETFAPFNMYANLTGCPLAGVPGPVDAGELPRGVLVFGPIGRDDRVLGLAREIERACPWGDRRPPVYA